MTVAPHTSPAPTAPSTTRAPGFERARARRFGERERHARGARVAELADAVEHPLPLDPQPLGDRGEDARSWPGGRRTGRRPPSPSPARASTSQGRARQLVDGHQERLVAVHLQHRRSRAWRGSSRRRRRRCRARTARSARRRPGETTSAPAPSPNSGAVRRSSKSMKRVRISAPITSTLRARPASIQRGRVRERGERARARGADVDRRRRRRAQLVRDDRRRPRA